MARYAMLIDLTRCIGCDACTVACKQENGTPVDTFFARVLNIESGRFPETKRVYLPVLCNHCDDAPCLKACPNKAIFRRPDGIVLIDQNRCRGTGACVSACPYGNVYLQKVDRWYLNEDEPYEKDFVKPRLNRNVARKCTYCAHRVDEGLNPACVVACPTTARIFGDMEDATSDISKYIVEQASETKRTPFHLLPDAKTKPATCYLRTLAAQESSMGGGLPESRDGTQASPKTEATAVLRSLLLVLLLLSAILFAKPAFSQSPQRADIYSTSTCVGCHGLNGMGGMGPPIVKTKLTKEEFSKLIRSGKGMMPAIDASQLSDEDIGATYQELQEKPWDEKGIPIAYKVGQLLSVKNLGMFFGIISTISGLCALWVLLYWIRNAGLKYLMPAIAKLGVFKSFGIVVTSLVVDGLLVASLWKRSKHRWFKHGLMLYGFLGLMAGDIVMNITNPGRSHLPLSHPLKMFIVFCGVCVLSGVLYVMTRYKTDKYIDNGLTLGRDFLFLNLLFHTIISGFFVWIIGKSSATTWVQPIYIYHLCSIGLLILSAPFTRFQHAFVVPVMVALTRLTEAATEAGADIGFQREPSPGRHHKSQRIAEGLMKTLEPNADEKVNLRYYP
ncbi:MAG: 4Fe-4S dicluster domain-containing protein [Fimbriimonadales bacterium]